MAQFESNEIEHEARAGRLSGWARPAAAAVGIFVLLAWPLIISGVVKGRGAHDQLNYHEQVIRTFAEQWPSLGYGDYLSATTPGYHTVLAAVAATGLDHRAVLQLVGSLFTVGLLLLLAWGIRGARGEGPTRLVLLLPFVLSMPVLYAGIWLLPDNAGWLGVLAVWLVALRPRFDAWTIAAGAVLLAALVFFRQIHIWPLAMLITCAWLGGSRDGSSFRLLDEWRAMTDRPLRRAARVALVLGAAVPAVAVLWWFSETWGGLTPPVFHERHVGGNPSAPAFVLAVFGSLGIFFAPFVLPELREAWRGQRWLPIAFATLGLGLGLLAPTTRDVTQGRYSGLWDLASLLPAPGGRSIVIVPLAAIGSVLLAGWFLALGRRDRWIMLAAIVAFTAAQCASFKLWQRYTEPMVLIWLALAAARVAPSHSGGEGWRFLGPAALACLLGLQTAASLVMARPVTPRALIAPWEERAPILPGMLDLEAADPDDGANPSGRSEEDRDP